MANIPFLNNAYFSAKVGIGTDSPQGILDVRSDASNSVPKIIVGNSTTTYNQTNSGSIVFTEGGTFEHMEITYNGASNKLLFNSPIDSATGLLTINRTGNVGIGTTSPGAKLNVAGDILIDSGEYISWGTVGSTSIEGSTASNKLQFRTNSSDRMIIDSSGNVGIGTTSPSVKLQINHTGGNNGIRIISPNDVNGFLQFGDSDDANVGRIIYGHSSDSMQFVTNDAERIRIDDSGNVGIGTTSPTRALDVAGVIQAQGFFKSLVSSSSTNLATSNGGSLNLTNSSATDGNFSNIGGYNSNSLVTSQINFINVSHASRTGDISFNTHNGSALTERMRIASNGAIQFNDYGAGTLVTDASGNITVSSGGGAGGPYLPLAGGTMTGTITMNNNRITSIEELRFNNGGNIGNQINTDVDTGTETVANVEIATYTAAFFDFVVKKTTNVRSGTVYACHDGTNVEFTETSTNDLGDTSDVTLSVDISGTNMRLLATVTSDDWSVKSLIRAI